MDDELIYLLAAALTDFHGCVDDDYIAPDGLEDFLDGWFTMERFYRERERLMVN